MVIANEKKLRIKDGSFSRRRVETKQEDRRPLYSERISRIQEVFFAHGENTFSAERLNHKDLT